MNSCKGCVREDVVDSDDNELCDDCSVSTGEECSCHINPPCNACIDNNYEEKTEEM